MTYQEAAAYRMPLGKHAGKMLDDIAATDAGLLYLDWLRGERDKGGGIRSRLDEALASYLDDKTIAAELAKLAR